MKDTKKIAKRGMLIFLVLVALCMFFARTVQNLTTPKVRFTQSSTGKLSKFYSLEAEVYFEEKESIYEKSATGFPIVIGRVYISADSNVKKDQLLMTASVLDYEAKLYEMQNEYRAKSDELATLDAQNRKNPTTTERNKRYEVLLDAMQTLSNKRVESLAAGLTEEAWANEQKAYENARQAFYDTYSYSSLAVTDEVFTYVKQREALVSAMDDLESNMRELRSVNEAVKQIRAPRDGVIITCEIKNGDTYNGLTPLYEMNATEKAPVLRAQTSERFAVDTKASVRGDWDEQTTKVVASGIGSDGQRYVDFELNQNILDARGGLSGIMKNGKLKVTISSRASSSATLINASCLRESDDGNFVYEAEYVSGGLMGGYYRAKKTTVTVIDKSDTQVSIQEDLGYATLIDREDRPLSDNVRVMEQEQ